ncbi:hypothetical protein [Nitrosopumilus ureiphilus]|uniref:Uncharacterized protein n=1 Tax=Nitrosopumilus ureiphilus TaxID=1470067 RepID=A0A7D5M6H4_9ARCH|nr:hypothetical protein [Nitrosopumilus ureiphilus]QLH07151.1 hypothetical protein C5F50_08735 [Nitrosopumilus ureiphilus]
MKTRLLIIIAAFLVSIPWIRGLEFGMNNQVMWNGITINSIIVMTLTIMFSLMSWVLFSWASKNIKPIGIPLSIITGTSLLIPFSQVLGPMAGIIVGIVAGFAAFMLQKKIISPAQNTSLIIAAITIVATYFVLILMILAIQTSSFVWNTGGVIGQCDLPLIFCTHFYEFHLGGGSIDLDPDLSPSYALDFAGGLFYPIFLQLLVLFGIISSLFLTPYFILKRKNTPSKPYLSLILSGLLLFFGIPSFIASLQTFAIILSQPEQIRTWVFDPQFILLLMPIIVSIIAGILLYRSSVIRKLIKK